MKYSLTFRRKKWNSGGDEEEEQEPEKPPEIEHERLSERRRRFSLSTPSELGPRSPHRGPRGSSFTLEDASDDFLAPSQKPLAPSHSSSRVERLLRERQLRRSGSCFQFNEGDGVPPTPSASGPDGSTTEVLGSDSRNSSYESLSLSAERASLLASATPPQPQRLLVVANRLPLRAIKTSEGEWSLELSSGGLVSALMGVKQNFETCWIGWPGLYLSDEKGQKELTEALKAKGCVPVLLDEPTVDGYYNGYCNNVLWPLFHYIGLPQEDRLSKTRSIQSQYAAYRRANELFAKVVLAHHTPGDVVWVHDYHLMLLPAFLKEAHADMKVGWFLHTPFPSSEVFRMLPLRGEILQAVLAADLVGFHTYDYARHFVSSCTRILGLEGTPDGVEDQGRLTRVSAFPIGIDPERFIAALETPVVKSHIAELKARFTGRKIMLGVDRLDMIKGIPQKLVAFEKFLEDHPTWRDRVLLVQIAVPSRTDVPEYQRLKSQVHEIVGRINGRFGTFTAYPVHYLDRSLAFHELCALYAITDVCLVTSLRDGMNLVSYEYVACQNQRKGVLVLSEFAGAAQSLGAGAILVNPWNVFDVAAAIEDALTMSEEERSERHKHNFRHVVGHTAQAWADTFVSELNDTLVEAELRTLRIPQQLPISVAVDKFHRAHNRLLILGYNATLTAHVEAPRRRTPDQIKEMKVKMHPALPPVLTRLTQDPANTIVILSGSERAPLDEAFSGYNLWLAAENGMFLRHTRGGEWVTTMPEYLNIDWVENVQLVFDYFCERTPRSYVESRETSLVWNYKYADIEFGRLQARDLLQHLWAGPISNAAVEVVQGGRSVEVRPVGVSKGTSIERILGEIVQKKPITTPIDYVMVVGHFLSKDEDIYTFFEGEEEEPVLREGAPGGSDAAAGRGEASTSAPRQTERKSTSRGEGRSFGRRGKRAVGSGPSCTVGGSGGAGGSRLHHQLLQQFQQQNQAAEKGKQQQAAGGGSTGAGGKNSAVQLHSAGSASSKGSAVMVGRSSGSSTESSSSIGSESPGSLKNNVRGDTHSHLHQFPDMGDNDGNTTSSERGPSMDSDSARSSGEFWPTLDLKPDDYFSCSVGIKRTLAKYSVVTSEEVVVMLKAISHGYALGPRFRTG